MNSARSSVYMRTREKKHHCEVVSNPASYSGDPKFNSCPTDWLLELAWVSTAPLIHCSHHHSTIQCCVTCTVEVS